MDLEPQLVFTSATHSTSNAKAAAAALSPAPATATNLAQRDIGARANAATRAHQLCCSQNAQEGGDMGDTIAILLLLTIILTAVCAFLGWYSRRRG